MNNRMPGRNNRTGSPHKGEPEYVLIGKLQRSHGVTGEIVLGLSTDFPERIKRGKLVYLGADHSPRMISGARPFHNHMLITMDGVRTREEAAELTNLEVFVRTDELPVLTEGQYYHHQLIGLIAVLEDGREIGTVTEIMETGANDVYIVTGADGKEVLLPAIEPVIIKIDVASKQMVVKPPEWE
jgi:16S rRNA processing protein RimM